MADLRGGASGEGQEEAAEGARGNGGAPSNSNNHALSHTVEKDEKLAHFQNITGMHDMALSEHILASHGWDLDAAVMAAMDGDVGRLPSQEGGTAALNYSPLGLRRGYAAGSGVVYDQNLGLRQFGANESDMAGQAESRNMVGQRVVAINQNPGLVWRIVTLPISIVRGGFGIMYGAVGLGMWVAGGILSYSLGVLGFGSDGARPGDRLGDGRNPLLRSPPGASEAAMFLRNFEAEYGEQHPAFQASSFIDSLRRASEQFKFLFVYLHSPEHANTPGFCQRTLCSEQVVNFVNENFVSWGGDIRTTEGFQMSNSLKASTFPFCAVVMASTGQRIALLQQIEGPKSADELVASLQRVIEDQGATLVAARVEEEERRMNRRLREEQDAAYQVALLADQERERKRQEEEERTRREAAEAERKKQEEEQAAARAAAEAAEREAALERRRQEKAMSLGSEPEKGPDVTQVLVRFPNGERKERRFHSTSTVQAVYDYVDSLGCLNVVKYSLVSNFPRTVYSSEKLGFTLKDAGLHPHASLFVQVEDG